MPGFDSIPSRPTTVPAASSVATSESTSAGRGEQMLPGLCDEPPADEDDTPREWRGNNDTEEIKEPRSSAANPMD